VLYKKLKGFLGMGNKSKIEWTDVTWNPVTGCTPVSAGCHNCYAKSMSARLKAMGSYKYRNEFEITTHEEELEKPMLWQKPRKIFVCSMSDLFHEDIDEEFIKEVFIVMQNNPQHTYLLLTKRPQNMLNALRWMHHSSPSIPPESIPHVWLGVTAENQKSANKRIPLLLKAPAAVRFVSFEPLLEEIELEEEWMCRQSKIDWMIVGGETGPGARIMDPDWAGELMIASFSYGIPFFMKQMSNRDPIPEELMIREYPEGLRKNCMKRNRVALSATKLINRPRGGREKGEWPTRITGSQKENME
jgi:protein gp37